MIKSMTGYGRGDYQGTAGSYSVEVSSTNHRYLELKVRLPRGWMGFEPRIRRELSNRFKRGHFDLYLTYRGRGWRGDEGEELALDWGLAEGYVHSLKLLKKRLGLAGRVDVQLVAAMREIFPPVERAITEVCWDEMQKTLHQALDGLEGMRNQEGLILEAQIRRGFLDVERLLHLILSRWPEAKEDHQRKIRGRIEEIMQGKGIDSARTEQELALWAERWDISEETTRLSSHLRQAQVFLAQDASSGRSLDFLLQEMNREANTIAAKAADALVSQSVIEMKTELEKIREQVQNVE